MLFFRAVWLVGWSPLSLVAPPLPPLSLAEPSRPEALLSGVGPQPQLAAAPAATCCAERDFWSMRAAAFFQRGTWSSRQAFSTSSTRKWLCITCFWFGGLGGHTGTGLGGQAADAVATGVAWLPRDPSAASAHMSKHTSVRLLAPWPLAPTCGSMGEQSLPTRTRAPCRQA